MDQYCIIAHEPILNVQGKDQPIADQVVTNYKKANILDRHKAMLNFPLKVSNNSKSITRKHHKNYWNLDVVTTIYRELLG